MVCRLIESLMPWRSWPYQALIIGWHHLIVRCKHMLLQKWLASECQATALCRTSAQVVSPLHA